MNKIFHMKADRFDIVTMAAAAALLLCAVYYAVQGGGETATAAAVKRSLQPPGQETVLKIAAAKTMLEAGQVKESVESLKALSSQEPGLADAHALLGQAYARLLDYPSAVKEYRLALSLDADYVDSKSPKFIGKRIKAAVKEAKRDPAGKTYQADISYIDRMLAGGCE